MSLLIGFLTFVLVMNCLFLILLILIQLPKKEAGAGIAFGGAATDALFGAGSGNALTKMTKYSSSLFVGMAVLLSVLHMQAANRSTRVLQDELSRQANAPAPVIPSRPASNSINVPVALPSAAPTTTPAASPNLLTTTPGNTPATAAPATTPAPVTATTPPPATTPTPEAPVAAPSPTPAVPETTPAK